nr:hypothetical protein CFP56_33015 [Quercus suber]
MANLEQNRKESVGSQREDHLVNLERMRDREHNPTPSVMVETQHTERTERSHSKTRSHVLHEQETRKLRHEIDHLCKKLRQRERDRRNSPPPSSEGSKESRDRSYHHKSRTTSSESFSASSHLDKLDRHRYKRGECSSH